MVTIRLGQFSCDVVSALRVLVDDEDLRVAVDDFDHLYGERDTILFIERAPIGPRDVFHPANERHKERITTERRERIAIASVRRDTETESGTGIQRVCKAITSLPESRLAENRHRERIPAALSKFAHGCYPLRKVRLIGFVFPSPERNVEREGIANETLYDRIGLIAIAHHVVRGCLEHGVVDNE